MNEELDLVALANRLQDEKKVSDFLKILAGDALSVGVITLGCYGSIYIRPMKFDPQHRIVNGHGHNYAHTTMWFQGSIASKCFLDPSNPVEQIHRALSFQNIPAKVIHEFIALTPHAMGACVFPHRDYKGNIVEQFTGNMFAYE